MRSYGENWAPNWVQWGQSRSFTWDDARGAPFTLETRQLVNVIFDRPTTWTLKTVVDFAFVAGEAATGVVTVKKSIGVGEISVTILTRVPFGPPYAQIVDSDSLPAQAMQVEVSVDITGGNVGSHTLSVACLTAPEFFEPSVGRQLPNGARAFP